MNQNGRIGGDGELSERGRQVSIVRRSHFYLHSCLKRSYTVSQNDVTHKCF